VLHLLPFYYFNTLAILLLFMLGQDATADQIINLRKDLGLDKSFVIQFFNFLINAAQGEFGISLRQGAKVSRLNCRAHASNT